MIFSAKLSRAQLKILSTVFSNAIIAWIVAIFGSTDVILLTIDIILAILSWQIAVKIEEELQNYD